MIAGVDEAGRGPVLGPLVVAAVAVETEKPLKKLGVKDSKLLSPKKREELAPQVRALCRASAIRVIPAEELNARMPKENLNDIEVDAFAELLRELAPDSAIVDACDVNAARFGQRIAAKLTAPCVIVSKHEADLKHPVVGAASILAKVERDRHVALLAKEHGDLGSGYSHDVKTTTWLKAYVDTHKALPPFARTAWETSRRLIVKDHTLLEFG